MLRESPRGLQALSAGVQGAEPPANPPEVRYKAFGEDRYTSGTTPTTYRYTGQRAESGIGLYYYGARWYDAALARFIQPDAIVPNPGNPQTLSRFSYVQNNPLRYVDPSGHRPEGYDQAADAGYPDRARRPEIKTDYLNAEGLVGNPRDDSPIVGIVMHRSGYASDTAAGVVGWFQGYDAEGEKVTASYNYLIDNDGKIYQLFSDDTAANHAALGEWTPAGTGIPYSGPNLNKHTIGISVVGASGEPYNDAQKASAMILVAYLAYTYEIDPQNIVSHKEISTTGKPDGAEYLEELRQGAAYCQTRMSELPDHGNPRGH